MLNLNYKQINKPFKRECYVNKFLSLFLVLGLLFGLVLCVNVSSFARQEKGAVFTQYISGKSLPSGEVPADFPKDIPLYPGAQVVMGISEKKSEYKEKVIALQMQTRDSSEGVISFYKKNLPKNGWKITGDESKMTIGQDFVSTLIEARKGNRKLQINTVGTPDLTMVTLVVRQKEKE